MITNPLLSSFDGTNTEAIEGLLTVCFPDARTILDPTFGKGNFYSGSQRRIFRGDSNPVRAGDVVCDFRALPIQDNGVDVCVYGPPFQPHTRNGAGLIGRQYTKVQGRPGQEFSMDAVRELKKLVQAGAQECYRASSKGIIVKVQDYIHSRRPVWMSMWLWEALGEPYDFLTRRNPHKLSRENWVNQLSVHRNHSSFWVWRKDSKGNYHVLRN